MEIPASQSRIGIRQSCYIFGLFIVIWGFANLAFAQNRPRVDLALVLAVDCSFSVDRHEYDLQMKGLALALSSEEVISSILSGTHGRVMITLVQWAGRKGQYVSVPWTLIAGAGDMQNFAGTIAAAPRRTSGRTSISSIIDFSSQQFSKLPARATRLVMDISADGVNNTGELPKAARERAIGAGITINGLAIVNEIAGLDSYFEKYIIGGPGHFVLVANDYVSYQEAIKLKLLKEIRGEPLS